MRPVTVPLATLFTATALLTGSAEGVQTVTLDQGMFRLMVDGRQIGTETFSIRRTGRGSGAVTTARGRILLNRSGSSETIVSSLEVAGPSLRPTSYRVVIEGGSHPRRLAGRVIGRRFSARIISPAGERMREYLVADGAILVDEGVAHHYFFIARQLTGGSLRVPIIIPRANRQARAIVTAKGSEAIEIAGQSVRARHFAVDVAGGSLRHVWVDEEGRVLRLQVPERNYTAVRTGLPG